MITRELEKVFERHKELQAFHFFLFFFFRFKKKGNNKEYCIKEKPDCEIKQKKTKKLILTWLHFIRLGRVVGGGEGELANGVMMKLDCVYAALSLLIGWQLYDRLVFSLRRL